MKLTTTLIAAATALTMASTAHANSYFSFADDLERSSTLELGQVVAAGNGTISIYDYNRGTQGVLLGTQDVRAGANYDVHVNVGKRPINDVIAVLTVNGQVVATQDYDIPRF